MFNSIFQFELRFWLRHPSTYIYSAILFFIALALMGGRAEAFDEHSLFYNPVRLANAPASIVEMVLFLIPLILFMLPAIMGMSVYRDFKSNMHFLLYAYPFSKRDYLLAKLCSSLLIVIGVVFFMMLGLIVGTWLPTANPTLIQAFSISAYIQALTIYLLPNLLILGAMIFGIVLFTRNIYAGFILAILLIIFQNLSYSLFGGLENQMLGAIIEPFGKQAFGYYSRFWKVEDFNHQKVLFDQQVIFNRLIWMLIGGLVYGAIFTFFKFQQFPFSLKTIAKKTNKLFEKEKISIPKVDLTTVHFNYSPLHYFKTAWKLSNLELRSILKSGLFLSILGAGMLLIVFQQYQQPQQYGFKILPVTWQMLRIPAFLFGGIINMLTFLYAGILVHRERRSGMNALVDSTPVPNWMLLLAKFLTLVNMQLLLLGLIMVGGVVVQVYQGYYHLELGQYLFQLYAMNFWSHLIWAMIAIGVQTTLPNPYLGFFLLILGSMGIAGLPDVLGWESAIFRFNANPPYEYSDLDGYGNSLPAFYFYKIYWLLLSLAFLFLSYLFWVRGLYFSIKERIAIIFSKMKSPAVLPFLLAIIAFLSLGFYIYYEEEVNYDKITTSKDRAAWMAANEKKYKKYQDLVQPKITDIQIQLDLFPEHRDFKSKGSYTLVNKSQTPIDTLLIHYSYDEPTTYEIEAEYEIINIDTIIRLDILKLLNPMAPGDSLLFQFAVRNEPNTIFHSSSPVKENGTFFTNEVFPGFGYRPIELRNNNQRRKYGLSERDYFIPSPGDSLARMKNYANDDADWLHFEAIVSTTPDQIALAPGYLQRTWEKHGRRYFKYKMTSKIKHLFGFNSGRFQVKRDTWNDIDLEVYYHENHDHNIERMIDGLKGTLTYSEKYFSPYQHRQARIIEFPISIGSFATTFANSIPFSEIRFIGEVDEANEASIDLPFYVAAHELAHQWWGNQVLPADVLGAKMLTESLAEYVALKVLKAYRGETQMRRFLQLNRDLYLTGRADEDRQEMPLMLSYPDQDYINYRKGALVFCTLSDYLGKKRLNQALKNYLESVKFQEAPFTTSLELVKTIRQFTPDSLQYLLKDMFETITFYDNKITSTSVKQLETGEYQVTIDFRVQKFRDDGFGNFYYSDEQPTGAKQPNDDSPAPSLPLADYIELGVFLDNQELHLKKYKITAVENQLTIIVDKKPTMLGIDPYHRLIELNTKDNRKKIDQVISIASKNGSR